MASNPRRLGNTEAWPLVISGGGSLLGVVLLAEVVLVARGGNPTTEAFQIGVLTAVPFIGGLIYGGYWLAQSDLPADRYPQIGRWWAGGLIGSVLLISWINFSLQEMTTQLLVSTVRWGGAVGGGVGLMLGVSRAYAVQRALEAARARERERELQRQRDRLEEVTGIVTYDLRSPLNIAKGHLDLVQEECSNPHLEEVSGALEQMEALINDTLTLARTGQDVDDPATVEVSALAEECWQTVETGGATLRIMDTAAIKADESRLQLLFEQLFENAIEHGGDAVEIRVGTLDTSAGFYVADDGSGIPESDHEHVFESGYSASDGPGLGLGIVENIANAHGWEVRATDSRDGGARFEITGVNLADG